jgi:hypothetical protein
MHWRAHLEPGAGLPMPYAAQLESCGPTSGSLRIADDVVIKTKIDMLKKSVPRERLAT